MSQSTTFKQQELLSTQNNAEETHKQQSTLVEREPIDKTPFWLITNQDGSFITLGEYRITEVKKDKAEALDELRNNEWNIIMHMCAVIVEKSLEERKRLEK